MKFPIPEVTIPVLMISAIALSACGNKSLLGKFQELQQKGETYAAKGLSETVVYRCSTMSVDQRKHLLDEVNADLQAKGSPARASSLDCDGSGTPDF